MNPNVKVLYTWFYMQKLLTSNIDTFAVVKAVVRLASLNIISGDVGFLDGFMDKYGIKHRSDNE